MSSVLYIHGMPFEEKSAWIMGVLAIGTYAAYVAVILGRAGDTAFADVAYVSTMLWTIGVSIAASIVLHVLVATFSPKDDRRKDQRDKEISRFGEYVGQSFLVVGGVSALGMSMAELDHFWISNAIYLAFVLSAILGSAARIVAYRRGFQPW
jgi:membrane protein implicated in regulation of membrane protease activity